MADLIRILAVSHPCCVSMGVVPNFVPFLSVPQMRGLNKKGVEWIGTSPPAGGKAA